MTVRAPGGRETTQVAPHEERVADGIALKDDDPRNAPSRLRLPDDDRLASPSGVARVGRRILATLRQAPWPTIALHTAVILGLLLLSVLTWWRVWVTGHPTSTITCQCGDVSQAVWFQAWTPWALAHGHNPMLSNTIFAGQGGANMLINTSWIFPSLLLAPVTWLFGPIASFNVGVTLAPVVSGWAFFVAVRAFTRFVPGQLLGASLWAFSPFVLAGLPAGHFQLSWLFYPPLALLLLYDLFYARRHSPLFVGTALGLLTVVQFFTGTEVLAMTIVVGAFASLVAAVLAPRSAWEHRRRILVGLGIAGGLAVVLLAYPMWFLIEGPRHIVGSQWSNTAFFGNAPSAVLDVGSGVHKTSPFLSIGGYFGAAGPSAPFLGAGLLVFLGVSALSWYRLRVAWVVVSAGLFAWLLSFGRVFEALSRPRPKVPSWWLPWSYLSRLPLMGDVIAQRFSLFATFAAALLLAISADRWWRLGRTAASALRTRATRTDLEPARRPRSSGLAGAGPLVLWGLAVTGVCWLVLSPIASANSFPYVVRPSAVPAWFTREAPRLPTGTVVLTLPDPSSGSVAAMSWQAEDAMQISIVGGYADTPARDGRSQWAEKPQGVLNVLDSLSDPLAKLPSGSLAEVTSVRAALARWGVQVVVVTDQLVSPAFDVGYMTAVMGREPVQQDGAWVWYGLGHSPPLSLAPGTFARCSTTSVGVAVDVSHSAGVARCVVGAAR